jgi:hypothetical protein
MDTKQDAVRIGGLTRTLEELDRELGRLALLCKVPILEPGVIDRVLHGDHLVCGADNPIAFAKLRELLMMHFAIHKKWASELGERQVVAIESYVIERLRKSLPELTEPWTPRASA